MVRKINSSQLYSMETTFSRSERQAEEENQIYKIMTIELRVIKQNILTMKSGKMKIRTLQKLNEKKKLKSQITYLFDSKAN